MEEVEQLCQASLASIHLSCFMNAIDFYLLEAVVSFCNQTKTAASCQKAINVPFSAPAGQVTQQDK